MPKVQNDIDQNYVPIEWSADHEILTGNHEQRVVCFHRQNLDATRKRSLVPQIDILPILSLTQSIPCDQKRIKL